MHETRVDMDQTIYKHFRFVLMPGTRQETKEECDVASAAKTKASKAPEKASDLAAPVTPAANVRRSATSQSDLGSEKEPKTCKKYLNFTPSPVSAKPKRKEGPKGKDRPAHVEPEPKRRMRRRVSKADTEVKPTAAKAAAGKKRKASTARDPAAPEPETTEVPPKRFRKKQPPSVPKEEATPTPARRAKAAAASEAVSQSLKRTTTQVLQTPQEKGMTPGKDTGKDGERHQDLKDTGKGKESEGKDESNETNGPDAKVATPSDGGKGNEDEADQDSTKAPKKRRNKTPAEKAAHARYMRFSRSLDSSFLS